MGNFELPEAGAERADNSRDYVYIREPAAIEPLIQQIGSSNSVALDTEADSLHSYFEKICLIQLSVAGKQYLVDPLSKLDLSGLSEAIADKQLIFHGGDYDLRMLRASLGFRPRGEVFDTMIAAQVLGMEQLGLGTLIERCFGIRMGKS